VEDDLAALLGMVYKYSKDVVDSPHMKFIGFELQVGNDNVVVSVPLAFQAEVAELIKTHCVSGDCSPEIAMLE
jgi:hypothetical protein